MVNELTTKDVLNDMFAIENTTGNVKKYIDMSAEMVKPERWARYPSKFNRTSIQKCIINPNTLQTVTGPFGRKNQYFQFAAYSMGMFYNIKGGVQPIYDRVPFVLMWTQSAALVGKGILALRNKSGLISSISCPAEFLAS